MSRPICIDLYCGLGGWSEGFLAEGYECRGYDIEAHDYGTGGYPGELRIRDVRSIHGSELKDATCIVGSSPCQEFSYRAMPWKRAKALPPPYLGMELFNHQFRIQREASEAAGHYIPMVVENVRGAQKWVGRAKANFGSFYLWGDVGMVGNRVVCVVNGKLLGGAGVRPTRALKAPGMNWNEWKGWDGTEANKPASVRPWGDAAVKTTGEEWAEIYAGHLDGEEDGRKVSMNFHEHEKTGKPGRSFQSAAVEEMGIKQGGDWLGKDCESSMSRLYGSKSPKRKMASAMIAKIPFPLAQHIARTYKPVDA